MKGLAKVGDYVVNSKGTIFKVLPEDVEIINSMPNSYEESSEIDFDHQQYDIDFYNPEIKSSKSEDELQHGLNQLLKGRFFALTVDKEGKSKTYGL